MKIPTWLCAIVCAGFTSWLGWVSLSISDLKGEVRELRFALVNKHTASTPPPTKGSQ